MGKLAYERERCLVCGRPLTHKPRGRPKSHCSDACRQRDFREFRKWVKATVEAELAGGDELPKDWRHGHESSVTSVTNLS